MFLSASLQLDGDSRAGPKRVDPKIGSVPKQHRSEARPSLVPVAQQQIHASDSQKCDHFHAKRHRITLDVPWLMTSRIDLRGGDTRDVG
jgi:hypothetical protein